MMCDALMIDSSDSQDSDLPKKASLADTILRKQKSRQERQSVM